MLLGLRDEPVRHPRKDAGTARVICEVAIGAGAAEGGDLAVRIALQDTRLSQAELPALTEEAPEWICPCSHVARENVIVELRVCSA